MTSPVFFADPADLSGLRVGDPYVLGGAEGRHATTVKRLARNEPVDLCDGAGLRLSCIVAAAEPGALHLVVERIRHEAAPAVELVLVQALAKGDRDELAIATATELGVDAVVPWQAERSIVRWKADKAAKGVAKWQAVTATAAKQARRARVPVVHDLVGTARLTALIADAGLAVVLHEEAPAPLRDVVVQWQATSEGAGRIVLIVGPEGGISEAEAAAFVTAGARPARLGQHVLRSSTAGPAAVVLVSDRLGRW